ncbi:MAG: hydrogenase iron-sulfur subunit [Firmicutes bacterium]|nr:hydrogenase iron-sulfur subunit [Bacillota bacterium]
MGVVIIGKNRINELLSERLNREGLSPVILEDINDIKRAEGEVGNFTIITGGKTGNTINATHIVITEESVFAAFPEELPEESGTEYLPVLTLDQLEGRDDINNISYISSVSNKNAPIVFLLDYPEESEAYNTHAVLIKAIEFAKKKRKVFCLLKFIRTAGPAEGSLERLYLDARSLGVTFVKYDNISINYDIEKNLFYIKAIHEIGSITIETSLLVWVGSLIPGEGLKNIYKMLRLKLNEEGFANGRNSFLYPTLTSRKGVYLINTKSLPGGDGELEDCINFTISSIKEDLSFLQTAKEKDVDIKKREHNLTQYSIYYAQVDSEKCAFCYTCYRACPHQAMYPDYENSVMKSLKNACCGCGICESVCPANAISIVEDNSLDVLDTAKKSDYPDNFNGCVIRKSLKIICCENSGEIAVKKILDRMEKLQEKIEIVPVSCGGKIATEMLLDSLKDFEKVLVMTCMDKACKHFEGNKRSKLHVDRARKLLRDLGLDENRIDYIQVSHAMPYVAEEHIRLLIDDRTKSTVT